MGETGLEISVLSIGAMRLPENEGEAVALLRRVIDLGCNYIDTSRGYGDSEIKVGKALTAEKGNEEWMKKERKGIKIICEEMEFYRLFP